MNRFPRESRDPWGDDFLRYPPTHTFYVRLSPHSTRSPSSMRYKQSNPGPRHQRPPPPIPHFRQPPLQMSMPSASTAPFLPARPPRLSTLPPELSRPPSKRSQRLTRARSKQSGTIRVIIDIDDDDLQTEDTLETESPTQYLHESPESHRDQHVLLNRKLSDLEHRIEDFEDSVNRTYLAKPILEETEEEEGEGGGDRLFQKFQDLHERVRKLTSDGCGGTRWEQDVRKWEMVKRVVDERLEQLLDRLEKVVSSKE